MVIQAHKEGISLSQLPSLYYDMFGEKLMFEELGYSKLKSLLETISDIEVMKNSKNHLKVINKKYAKVLTQSNPVTRKQSFNDSWKEKKSRKPNQAHEYCSNSDPMKWN